jgi:hypothetical protein
MASIYGLYDCDGALRYIGKANDPAKRLKGHMRDRQRRRSPLYDWLNKHGLPEMRVIEQDCADWCEAERRLITDARVRGEKLLNVADGGDEPHCPVEVRRRNGRHLADMRKTGNYPAALITREAIIRDTYEWALAFFQARGRYDKCVEVAEKMMTYARNEPEHFSRWRTIRVSSC